MNPPEPSAPPLAIKRPAEVPVSEELNIFTPSKLPHIAETRTTSPLVFEPFQSLNWIGHWAAGQEYPGSAFKEAAANKINQYLESFVDRGLHNDPDLSLRAATSIVDSIQNAGREARNIEIFKPIIPEFLTRDDEISRIVLANERAALTESFLGQLPAIAAKKGAASSTAPDVPDHAISVHGHPPTEEPMDTTQTDHHHSTDFQLN